MKLLKSQYLPFMFLQTAVSMCSVYLSVFTIVAFGVRGGGILAIGCIFYCLEMLCGYFICRNAIFKRTNRDYLRFFEYWILGALVGNIWQIIRMLLKAVLPFFSMAVLSILLTNSLFYCLCKRYIFDEIKEKFSKWWAAATILTVLMIPLSLVTTFSIAGDILNQAGQTHFVEPVVQLRPMQHTDGRYRTELDWSEGLAVEWDDNWFFDDLSQYNPELSFASLAISRMAYTESGFKNTGVESDNGKYLQNLGFEWVNTTSFTYRSKLMDKYANLFSGESNGATYITAGKQLRGMDGKTKNLIVVSVTGTLSFDVVDDLFMGWNGEYQEKGHKSFSNAAREIAAGFLTYPDLVDDDTIILLTGHSRGGAVANLAGADLVQLSEEKGIHPEIIVYTFACPKAAGIRQVGGQVYDTFFNVNNPYDIISWLPFESWGFSRYGRDVPLISENMVFTQEQQERIFALAEEIADRSYRYETTELALMPERMQQLQLAAGQSPRELLKPWNFLKFAKALAAIKPLKILNLHMPPVYMAIMQEMRR